MVENASGQGSFPTALAVSPIDGAVYVAGFSGAANSNWLVQRSTTGASGTFSTVDFTGSGLSGNPYCIAISPIDGAVYLGGNISNAWIVRRSATGASGTFVTIDSTGSLNSNVRSLAISSINGNVYAGGTVSGSWTIRSSSQAGASGTFGTVSSTGTVGKTLQVLALAVSPIDGAVYAGGILTSSWSILKSTTGASGTFTTAVDSLSVNNNFVNCIDISPIDGIIYGGWIGSSLYNVRASVPVVFNSSSMAIVNGATGVYLRRTLKDLNDVNIVNGVSFINTSYEPNDITGYTSLYVHPLLSAQLKLSISRSF